MSDNYYYVNYQVIRAAAGSTAFLILPYALPVWGGGGGYPDGKTVI